MTPKQVTTIDVKELKEIELRCECGSAIRLKLPPKSVNLLAAQDCPGCARQLWTGTTDPTRIKLDRLLSSLESWKDAANPVLSVAFVLTEPFQHGS